MTVSVSAASADETVSQVSTSPKAQGNAPQTRGPLRVEFIYTPDIRRFGCTFNDLCSAQWSKPRGLPSKCVDDLDRPVPTSPRATVIRPLRSLAARRKTSHNGHCVTLEPRRRYNMSHRRHSQGRWHARCLYNIKTGDESPYGPSPREGSKQVDLKIA